MKYVKTYQFIYSVLRKADSSKRSVPNHMNNKSTGNNVKESGHCLITGITPGICLILRKATINRSHVGDL
jgi:hypothetical protein